MRNLVTDDPVLPFDFFRDEKEAWDEKIKALPFYENPKNDKEFYFNLQKRFYSGENVLPDIYSLLLSLAPKLIKIEMRNRKLFFCHEVVDEIAVDSVCIFVEQIMKNKLIIKTSCVAYLRLQILKVMFNRTKAKKLEEFCIKNHICFFDLSMQEKESVKRQFENECKKEAKKWEKEVEATAYH